MASSVQQVGTNWSIAPLTRPAGPGPSVASVQPASVQVAGFGDSMGGIINTGSSLGHLYNGVSSALHGGKAAAGDVATIGKNVMKLNLFGSGMKGAVSGLANAALSTAKKSGVFAGAISLVANGYRFVKGQISFATLGARVVGDTASGFAGGAGAAVAGGIATAVLGAVGLTGGLLTIGGVAAGLVGYVMAENALRRTRIFQTVVNTVHSALGGASRAYSG